MCHRARVDNVATIVDLRRRLDAARGAGATVGFVPTMGYLHEGHLSLIARAAEQCDVVAASIFVNPLQFAPTEDLAAYPRDLPRDRARAERAGVDVLFTPTVAEMYPEPLLTTVSVRGLSESMEGRSRPTHFAGVATVVAKLFAIVGPCRAYFGEKDYQQLTIVRRMARDLSLPVEVVGCPIVREPDGLALSSRNVNLGPAERAAAVVLSQALQAGAAALVASERDVDAVRALMAGIIAAEPQAELDYAEVVSAADLEPSAVAAGDLRLLVAARFGSTRLLDNLGVRIA